MPRKSDKAARSRAAGPAPPPIHRWAWLLPCAVAFLASFCVMVVELVAGRLVARYLGDSLYTWTSAIGVVLGGLAAGHYVGGRLADRYRATSVLSVLLIVSSVCCLLSLPMNRLVGDWTALGRLSWPAHIATHIGLIFFWPAAVLGTIAPVVAKMALDQGRETGRTVGGVYAWGAIGSIVGTFMTGYWFIAVIGSTATIALVSAVLGTAGVAFAVRSWLSRTWTGMVVLLGLLLVCPWSWARAATVDLGLRDVASPYVLHRSESAYSFVKVTRLPDDPDLRALTLDRLVHSWVYVSDPTRLHYDYERMYAAVTRRRVPAGRPIRTLFLGGGGYTFPRYVERIWPGSRIDVAEIDPAVTATARRCLGLDPNSSIRIHHLDARNYLDDLLRDRRGNDDATRYDFVYGDAFNHYAIPFHLTTVEFNEKLRAVMADDGVYMLNVIDTLASGRFLGAVVNTLRETFDHVWVYSCRTGDSALASQGRDTFVVIASPSDVALARSDRRGRKRTDEDPLPGTLFPADVLARLDDRSEGLVLTDDYAPVEHLLTALHPRTGSADMYTEPGSLGLGLAMRRQYGPAAERYRQALLDDPNSAEARSNLGWVLYLQGHRDRALTLFREAISVDPALPSAWNNLGWVLYKQGEHADAIEAFTEALRLKPDYALARNNLGLALAARGAIERAVEEYREAIRLQPSFAEGHYNLGAALAQLGRTEEAAAAFVRTLALRPNHAEAHNDLGWLLHKAGQHAEAETHLREAIRYNPKLLRAMNNLGAVLTARGRHDEAIGVCAEVLNRDAGNAEACNTLGIAFGRLGKTEQAARWFGEALKFQPDHGPARSNLLALHMRNAQYAKAASLLRADLARNANQPGALSNLAWLLATCPQAELRDGAEAERLARQADELSAGRSPRALDALAAAQAEQRRFEHAAATARRALEAAKAIGHDKLADAIANRLAVYEAHRPFRQGQ